MQHLATPAIFFSSEKKKKVMFNQKEQIIFGVIIISNAKLKVARIEYYQLNNILIKLDHI